MAESEVGGHAGAAEVEVTVGQAQVLVGDLLIEREGQDIGLVEDLQIVGHDFDFAGREFGIFRAFKALSHRAGDLDDVLVAQGVRGLGRRGVLFGPEDHLGDALAVAQIDEDDPAVVAAGTDPTGEGGALTDIFGAQGAAMRTTEIHGAGVWRFAAQSASASWGSSVSVRALRSLILSFGHSSPTTRATAAPEASASLNWRPTLSALSG